ncbi:hypothetical protein Bca52824_039231 [Brassica carinata]|uniref:LOB domain-containing protein n=1 Tax=Brassica carinata TaxID=52824 RepID=A0A8X7UVN4_BRACI|nr:hypothetical protein Bca52824_039231 [Brassica carinata]
MQLHEQHNGPCTLGSGNSCVMAPYLPSKEPDKFDRILSRLEESWQSEYAVNALCYEAEARIHDPIHGYVEEIDSAINELEQKNQLTGLPDVDARRNVDEILGMRENDQGDVHRADGASKSSGPSSGPPNQNQP